MVVTPYGEMDLSGIGIRKAYGFIAKVNLNEYF